MLEIFAAVVLILAVIVFATVIVAGIYVLAGTISGLDLEEDEE